ncbi:MAG: FecR domain-containing protein [Williamsia sp.]|nr:FecR domain-containing protein [Williamsia sp.]
MENKEYNTVEDFVFNKSFQEWVLNNDPYSTRFWLNWISYNPDKTPLVNYSRAIVDSLPVHKREASEDEINDQIEQIISSTNGQPVVLPGDLITPRPRKRVLTISRRNWIKIVAIFVFAVACTWYLVTKHSGYPDPYKSFASGYTNSLVEVFNDADTAEAISLVDGSRVWLESKSRLSYTSDLLPEKREVFLSGKARLSIRKDPARPFFVYTQSTIAKSTGAELEVEGLPDKKMMITARQGSVQVFKRRDIHEGGTPFSKVAGIVITPNQQLVYNEANNLTYKTLVTDPAVVAKNQVAISSSSAVALLTALQDRYSIPIIFDQEALSHCRLSTDINAMSFYGALDAICKPLRASYEVMDGNVLINAAGCK